MVELASILVLGIAAQWLAWRLKVPAILPLILIGLAVGPFSTLITEDGSKFIEPVYNGDKGLFPGNLLFYFVSLAIGIILFEGGLTLKRKEVKGVGPVIIKLISIGSIVTFIGGGLAAHYLIGLSWTLSFLFAGLIIVTGPTVIAPILRNIPLKRNVATVLKWEGILIDPLGALVAVLVFDFIIASDTLQGSYSEIAFGEFAKIVVIGLALGFGGAHLLKTMIRRKLIPHYLLNVFSLAVVVFTFVLSDSIVHESGLLEVVIMGMVLGDMDLPEIKDILYFKESLSVLLIGILFILLSANIDLADLQALWHWNCLALFLVVVLILRPVGVLLSTWKSNLKFNEKAFISWVGPRGIVAAGIASLFGIDLERRGVPGAELITPLVFMIVLGTVLLNATTARWIAKLIGVTLTASEGILIIGASLPARLIAKYLHENDRHVALMDSNTENISRAKSLGLEAFEANIYSEDLEEHVELTDIGYLLAFTGSHEVNIYACDRYRSSFGENGTFRLLSSNEMTLPGLELPPDVLFSTTDDFINISEVARDNPNIYELDVPNPEAFEVMMKDILDNPSRVPLFVKDSEGKLHIIPIDYNIFEVAAGWKLVYMGKEMA